MITKSQSSFFLSIGTEPVAPNWWKLDPMNIGMNQLHNAVVFLRDSVKFRHSKTAVVDHLYNWRI